jgi:hypothetical protein
VGCSKILTCLYNILSNYIQMASALGFVLPVATHGHFPSRIRNTNALLSVQQ